MRLYKGYCDLAAILADHYDVGPLVADRPTVLWAVARLAKRIGEVNAHLQLTLLNRRRHRYGVPLVYTS